MHLLQARSGTIQEDEAVDTGQTPADIVVLSAADSELACLADSRNALDSLASPPSLRLANILRLAHNLSVDLYTDTVIAHAKIVVVRLLGGSGYWPYGVEQLVRTCRARQIPLALLPGDDSPDPELAALSTLPAADAHRLWLYCVHGGRDNAEEFLKFTASLIGCPASWREPKPLLRAGLYWPGLNAPALNDIRRNWTPENPVAAIIFYRALLQAGDLEPVDALIGALARRGINPLPLFTVSLKDAPAADIVRTLLHDSGAGIVLNATGFAVSHPGAPKDSPLDFINRPVLQVIFSGGSAQDWRDNTRGLPARDLAMNVMLPEVDGRIITRAVAFKSGDRFDDETQCPVVRWKSVPDRIDFTADLAVAWHALHETPAPHRRIAVVLANYPNRDARLGNGVGLDTPASIIRLLHALQKSGYDIADIPADGNDLIRRLAAGPTNAGVDGRTIRQTLPLDTYLTFFRALPDEVQTTITGRWGDPADDPFFLADQQAFALPVMHCGKISLCLQPARGYNIDPVSSYHDPALPPPHGYMAFHAWMRLDEKIHAVIHMGKHGNLEWLPGKALALSRGCFPEAALGPLPNLYPFIVNDPGEGTQAKRRAQAVIIDHLTPPLTRAGTYGDMAELERMVDEYYDAAGVDPRRVALLGRDIIALSRHAGIHRDCGIADDDSSDDALGKLDNFLCEIKEMQIRDGLHVFGAAPQGRQRTDLLVALTRLPRTGATGGESGPSGPSGKGGKGGKDSDESLIRAIAGDLNMPFDPLDCPLADPWSGPRPDVLADVLAEADPWRTTGDTLERIEALAARLVAGETAPDPGWRATGAVLDHITGTLAPQLDACGERELIGLLAGLDGRFVAPGPSGAPTRGRLDVLPTGRNFYSVDPRAVPTPAAWRLGWASADMLVQRYRQDHGAWPAAMALSAWGTANMRTGGDDIAQAMALIGARPQWDGASHRVTGFEILPLSIMDRPRVDVTLRVSGFFRDAFPVQMDLFDAAVRAVAGLDEPDDLNPVAARVRADTQALIRQGVSADDAGARAGFRVFGSRPGAYGAGLQALIDERGWETAGDLARAYLAWGGYAYGGGANGAPEHALFESRLARVDAVVHNQDNREHDLLDSDDYYQFEGGLTAAVETLSGSRPAVYHNDHSRPERPVVRPLEEEIARVVRARVVNPKWIDGVRRHGYKGAFEMAATVDYMFAFAATTGAVADHHFDAVYRAWLEDEDVRRFLRDNNPDALRDIARRLEEALQRGLWTTRSNTAQDALRQLAEEPSL